MDLITSEVVVIGGGLSGLCAAKLLSENGVDVVVLEARDRVGGRTQTLQDSRFKYTDLGGSYVGPTQDRVLRVAKELGIETYRVPFEGRVSEYLCGKRKEYDGEVSTWNPIAILDYFNLIRKLDSMCDAIDLNNPWESPKAQEWDRMTTEEFFKNTCWTTYCKKRMVQIYHDAMAAEPWDMSLLYYLWYLKSCDGVLRIAGIENAGQERKFIGGSQQISNKLKDLLGDKVCLAWLYSFIKYLRYYTRSDWLATVFISYDRTKVQNYFIKGPVVSIYCDINMYSGNCKALEKSKKRSATPHVSLQLLSCSTAPSVFISQNIDTHALSERFVPALTAFMHLLF